MPGFTSYDDLIDKITVSGQGSTFAFSKGPYTPQGAGVWYTLWTSAGMPGAGSAPASTPGTVYTQAAGSIYFPNRSPAQTHLLTFGAVANTACTLLLYDRLVGVGGIALSPAAAKTVNTQALPRYSGTNAAGVQAWLEVTTATASSGTVALSSYTNESGVAGRAGAAVGWPFAASNAGTMLGPMPLQAGDTGVRSVETVTTATSTAGVINVVLIRPLVYLPLTANNWQEKDMVLQIASMPQLYDGASLGVAIQASAASSTTVWGQLGIAWA